jgi:hypothetical protein
MPKHNNSVSGNQKIRRAPTPGGVGEYPAISFRFFTSNKRYTLDYFKAPQRRERLDATARIYSRLAEISCKEWRHWLTLPKEQGGEMLPEHRMNFKPSNADVRGDTKFIVFRTQTANGKGARIIGFREDGSSIFFVAGYDFDFTAYDHGR